MNLKHLIYCFVIIAITFSACVKDHDSNPDANAGTRFLIDSLYKYRLTSTGDSINSQRDYFTYDNKGRTIKNTSYYLKSATNIWDGDYQYEYEYNESGSLIKSAHYEWDEVNRKWAIDSSLNNTYNSSNQLITIEKFSYDMNTGLIKHGFKKEYTFNTNGIQVSQFNYSWSISNSNWIQEEKFEMQLDENGFNISSLFYLWNSISSAWDIKGEFINKCDIEGRIIQQDIYYNYYPNGIFYLSYKCYASYDSYGNIISDETYDFGTSTPFGLYRFEYEYNSQGNILIYKSYGWYQWNVKYPYVEDQREYTYDSKQNLTSYKLTFIKPHYYLEEISKEDYFYDSKGGRYYGIYYEWERRFMKKGSTIFYSSKHTVDEQSRKSVRETYAIPLPGTMDMNRPDIQTKDFNFRDAQEKDPEFPDPSN